MLENPQLLLLVIPILLFSIVIHEMAHGYVALFMGDDTAQRAGRLTLNPLVHLDPIWSVALPIATMLLAGIFIGAAKPVPYNPINLRDKRWGEFWIAIAGPISNIVIALVFAVILNGIYIMQLPVDGVITTGLFYVIFINIFLAVFNMIPVVPLDGSKVLFAITDSWQLRRFMEQYSLPMIFVALFILLNTSFVADFTAAVSQALIL